MGVNTLGRGGISGSNRTNMGFRFIRVVNMGLIGSVRVVNLDPKVP